MQNNFWDGFRYNMPKKWLTALKNRTILKQALLFKNNQEPNYSQIQKLYEKIITYQEQYQCYIMTAKPRQKSKLLNQKLFFSFLNELVDNKTITSFNDIEVYITPSHSRAESIKNQGDSKSYYSKVFNKTLLYKKKENITQLFTEEDIKELESIDNIIAIENAESFLNIQNNSYKFPYENYIYLGGHANHLTQTFLKEKRVLFFIDFDIISMNMYEDFIGYDKELFIPDNLEERFFIEHEPNYTLYKKQRIYLREDYGEETIRVITLIKKYHAVVEQEIVQ